MADYSGAMEAIKSRITANWSTTPLSFQNEPSPAVQDANANPTPWVHCEIFGLPGDIEGMGTPGNQTWLYDGLLHMHVFTPTGSGDAIGRQYADQLAEIFRNAEFYNGTPGFAVRTRTGYVDGGGPGSDDGLWYRHTATVPFEYWHRG